MSSHSLGPVHAEYEGNSRVANGEYCDYHIHMGGAGALD